MKIDVLIVPTIAVPLSNIQKEVKSLSYLRGLKLAHPVTDAESFDISLLIGADSYWKIVLNQVVRGNGPTAVKSKIGYLLSGPLPGKTQQPSAQYMLNVITTPPTTLDLERFWKLESIGITPEGVDTSGSRNLKTYMESNISYDEGRYIAKLPWKDDHLPLPTNYDVSVRRTENLIKRLRRQSADKPSLNDCLQSTPPELNDLAGILMRFRLKRYAIITDSKKALLHVSLDEKDRHVTRFLWLSDPDSPLTTYRFKAVLFGATCSPFILCATTIKHLENNSGNWVSNHLLRDIYVDNIISSFSQERDVVDFFRDTRALMSAANFNLRSWNSNSRIVREMAKVDHVLDNDGASKVLGMRWDAVKDTISFPERLIPVADIVTKRTILQHTSRMYDPLGLLIPVTIRAKIILQELWEKKYAWDSPLPHELQQKWQEIARDMNSASSSSFNRRLFNFEADDTVNAADETILHVFSYASMTSYGAAVYICRVNQSALVMAKSRVAPLKKLTLPRLELMAAVIGARLGTDHCDEPEPQSSSESSRNTIAGIHTIIDVTRYNTLGKLLRVTAYKHPFTRLVVIDAHERLLHSGSSSTITYFRQKYWVPVIRRCVQSVLRACVICRRVNGNSYHAPDPPALPKIRVEYAEPFTVTGVDFTGALYVRDKDGHEKIAYICLFTCASTRAVHLELVPDLTTETFLQAFRRFCSRKSLPRLMILDNATTYIGAANHLRELMQSNAGQEELNSKGTEWRFIVKRALWYGGWWERLIGLTKTAVKKVLGRSYVDFETLSTIITEVEAVINDGPLTYVTSGEVEAEQLTPSHLLYGRRFTKLPHSEDIELSGPRASNFENIDNFRVRWKTEYLTALREHHRVSGKNQQTINVGDVVQGYNETPRSSWKLAVVEETITGNDGLVRAARIWTQNGHHTTRPIVKLYPLKVMCDTVSARD
ncbi:uncharacterized protein LOC128245883 [Mya arenaria]|uniref:uncharacterized protein LOC128245883 n=1 Tax=Mya arenaria TaxID=6604 RepID=UPI0022E8C9B1|nr:uncharacterized protein LOC128245883 [Mya arenaria]